MGPNLRSCQNVRRNAVLFKILGFPKAHDTKWAPTYAAVRTFAEMQYCSNFWGFQKYMFPIVRLGSLGSTRLYFRETHCLRLLSQNNQGRNIIKHFDLEEGRSMFLRNAGIPNATAQCNISEDYNLKRFVI